VQFKLVGNPASGIFVLKFIKTRLSRLQDFLKGNIDAHGG
jgi:hypothetical protein